MKYIKEISLLLIAVVLASDFFISHIWPIIYLRVYHQDYYDSSVACAKAMVSFQEAEEAPSNLDFSVRQRLFLASQIELAQCHEHELLKKKALSNGVDQADLDVIDLKALENENVPLRSFVKSHLMRK